MDAHFKHLDFYKLLPKVELHRHLEGSLRLSTMLEIAQDHNLDLPYGNVEKFRSLVQVLETDPYNFLNFLSKFGTLRNFYQTPEAIMRIARESIVDAALDNIRYMELRFTPVALTRIREFPLGEAMDWVIESVKVASQEFGIKTNLIASLNRHESLKLAEEVMGLAVDRMERGIVGLDLAGNEAEFPGNNFENIFKEARDSGLNITIHAGEWGKAKVVKMAIDTLGAERIGHGVRIMEDDTIVELAKERKMVFEVCPTSNYQSGIVKKLEDHPLPEMIASGLVCTVNTDDPGISQIDLSDEYAICGEVLGITNEGLKTLILNSVESAFLPDDEKKILKDQLMNEYLEISKD